MDAGGVKGGRARKGVWRWSSNCLVPGVEDFSIGKHCVTEANASRRLQESWDVCLSLPPESNGQISAKAYGAARDTNMTLDEVG
jgi:hypothetical protein